MHLGTGMLNGRHVKFLRDPGATVSIARRDYVDPSQLTSRHITLKLINGYLCTHQVAQVDVDTPSYVGSLDVVVMPNPAFDLILGNNVHDSLSPDFFRQENATVAAVTRLQGKKSAEKKLKIDDVGDIMEDPNLPQLQREDTSLTKIRKYLEDGKEIKRGKNVSKFILVNGLIYRRVKSHHNIISMQLVVPMLYREIIFKVGHAGTLSGHMGKSKTMKRVSR